MALTVDPKECWAENMTKERRNEIAYILLKLALKKRALPVQDMKRELDDISKETKISFKELKTFANAFYQEIVEECFKE